MNMEWTPEMEDELASRLEATIKKVAEAFGVDAESAQITGNEDGWEFTLPAPEGRTPLTVSVRVSEQWGDEFLT